jgi:hypothetical protein
VLVLLMGGVLGVRCFDGLSWHNVFTKFYDDWFRHSSNIMVSVSSV